MRQSRLTLDRNKHRSVSMGSAEVTDRIDIAIRLIETS